MQKGPDKKQKNWDSQRSWSSRKEIMQFLSCQSKPQAVSLSRCTAGLHLRWKSFRQMKERAKFPSVRTQHLAWVC